MKSTITVDQWRELLVREERRDFGEDGLGPDLQWFADNWRTVRGLREGKIKLAQYPCQVHAPDLIPEEWTVAVIDGVPQDVAPSTFDVGKLKLRLFLKGDETSVSGEEMRKRAVELGGNLGLPDGKRMLAEQDKIPAEFRDFYIPLPGTVLRDPDGNLCVAFLSFSGGRWFLSFVRLGGGWVDYDRLACSE